MPELYRPERNRDYLLEELDEELLLYHPGRTRAIYLNDTARLVWNLCDGSRNAEEISELLEESYPDSKHAIAGEVPRLLRELEELGAISTAQPLDD